MVVVTLGHRLESETVHPLLRRRIDVAIDVFHTSDAPYLLFTGGRTNPEVSKAECEAMRDYAVECGVDPTDVLVENEALDTKGNGYFSRLLVEGLATDVDTVYVVTSCDHGERAKYIFEQCFGDGYEIRVEHCTEGTVSKSAASEERSRRRDYDFFEPITPGDIAGLRRRFAEEHDYYDHLLPVPGRAGR